MVKTTKVPENQPLAEDDLIHPEVTMNAGSNLGFYAALFGIVMVGFFVFNQLSASRSAAADGDALAALNEKISLATEEMMDAKRQTAAVQSELERSRREIRSLKSQPVQAADPVVIERIVEKIPKPKLSDQSLRAPALVIDNSAKPKDDKDATGALPAAAAGSAMSFFNDQLASATPPAAQARRTINRAQMIAQGAVISGVLETAIYSDLPGFTRAIVTHNVRSFDNSQVLIPRGSRLIGQYRSGLSLGEARVFVVWNRIIRPDGVSIDIASPATDTAGQSGLPGDVNRHYFQRFSGAILLSVLDIGARLATDNNSAQVILNSTNNIQGEVLRQQLTIPPTIEVDPGTEIRILLGQDLYFPPNLQEEGETK
ncbi:MAG: TrbI/VirB10 family protein [Sphingomonadales bacterium]